MKTTQSGDWGQILIGGERYDRVNPLPETGSFPEVHGHSARGYQAGSHDNSGGGQDPGGRGQWDLFVSYKSLDATLVRHIVEVLVRRGVRVWFAEYSVVLDNYDRFDSEILSAVNSCHRALLFTSRAYAGSIHCEQEVIWLRQRFHAQPERILEIALEDNHARSAFGLPAGCPRFALASPHRFMLESFLEHQQELAPLVEAVWRHLGHSSSPPWPCSLAAGLVAKTPETFSLATSPISFRHEGFQLEKCSVSPETHGDWLELKSTGTDLLGLECTLAVDFTMQTSPGEWLPVVPDGPLDDRKLYSEQRRLLEGHMLARIRELDPGVEGRGLHLVWLERPVPGSRAHIGLTIHSPQLGWRRWYSIILSGGELPRPVELMFTFRVPGPEIPFSRFLEVTSLTERLVQSIRIVEGTRSPRMEQEALQGNLLRQAKEAGGNADWETAIDLLRELIDQSPRKLGLDGEAWHYLVAAHLRTGRWKAAIEAGTKGDSTLPDGLLWKGRMLVGLGDAFIMNGDYGQADRVLRQAWTYLDNDTALDAERIKEALLLLQKRPDVDVRKRLFQLMGHSSDAADDRPEILQVGGLISRARQLADARNWLDCLRVVERILDEVPDDPESLHLKATCLLGLGELETAWTNGQSARRLIPKDSPWRGRLLYAMADIAILRRDDTAASSLLNDVSRHYVGQVRDLDAEGIALRQKALRQGQGPQLAIQLFRSLRLPVPASTLMSVRAAQLHSGSFPGPGGFSADAAAPRPIPARKRKSERPVEIRPGPFGTVAGPFLLTILGSGIIALLAGILCRLLPWDAVASVLSHLAFLTSIVLVPVGIAAGVKGWLYHPEGSIERSLHWVAAALALLFLPAAWFLPDPTHLGFDIWTLLIDDLRSHMR